MVREKIKKQLAMKEYLDLYKNELLNNVIPFWENNSPDKEYGGFLPALIGRERSTTQTNSCGCKLGRFGCLL